VAFQRNGICKQQSSQLHCACSIVLKGSESLLQRFWGNGFLDSRHLGVPFIKAPEPVVHLNHPAGVTAKRRREQLDLLSWMNNRQHDELNDPEILSRVAS